MKNLLNLFLIFGLMAICIGCGGDEDEPDPSGCAGVLNNGGELVIDGETLNLSVAQLIISSGLEGDSYLFQVGGLSNDCNELRSLNFNVEIPTNSDFDGTYAIVDFFGADLNDVTGVSIINLNVANQQQSIIEVNSGTMTVSKLADREYEVNMTGTLVGGGSIAASFNSEF